MSDPTLAFLAELQRQATTDRDHAVTARQVGDALRLDDQATRTAMDDAIGNDLARITSTRENRRIGDTELDQALELTTRGLALTESSAND